LIGLFAYPFLSIEALTRWLQNEHTFVSMGRLAKHAGHLLAAVINPFCAFAIAIFKTSFWP